MADIEPIAQGQREPGAPPTTEAPQAPLPATEPPGTEPSATEPPITQQAAPKPSKAPWFMDRIGEETAKRQEEQRLRVAAENERDELRRRLLGSTSPSTASVAFVPSLPAVPEDAVQAEVTRREELKRSGEIRSKGYEEFGQEAFTAAMNGYTVLGDEQQVMAFIRSAMDTDAPHKVLHFLGTNQEEGKRIMGLSPTKQAIEMDRLATKLATTPDEPVSKAPAPIRPVGGSGGKSEPNPDKMDTKAWIAWREKDVEEKRKSGMRIH